MRSNGCAKAAGEMKGNLVESCLGSAGSRVAVLLGMGSMLAGLLLAPPGYCQEKDELARRHFESGAAYFAEAEYEDALKAFIKAYELSNRPQILLNIAVVQERLGNLQGAVDSLDEYLTKNPEDPEVETIRLRRENLQRRLDEQLKQEPAPAPSPAVPAPEPPRSEPASPATPPPAPPPEPNRVPAYVSLSVGALAGVGAALTGIGANSEYRSLEDECSGHCSSEQTNTGKTLALTSTILTGVSVLGLGAGIVLWVTADPAEDERATSAKLDVNVGSSGAFASARWRF